VRWSKAFNREFLTLYWGMESESTSAYTEWVGDLQHDHPRCCFRIGHEFLGECRQRGIMGVDAGENLQVKLLRKVESDLDEWSNREGDIPLSYLFIGLPLSVFSHIVSPRHLPGILLLVFDYCLSSKDRPPLSTCYCKRQTNVSPLSS
jgi:hypothetical protein